MKVRIKDEQRFRNTVFGAECFLEHWPEIATEGVKVDKLGKFYYIVDENGKPHNNSAFFSEEEMETLEKV